MSLSYAILGLINYAPMAGYDLKKVFDDSINFFWSAQTSQIYRELNKWEQKGCIKSMVQSSERGPEKRVYSITGKGVEYLRNWLSDMPDEVDEDNRNAFLLRIFLLCQMGADELMFQIQKRLKKYKRDLQSLKEVENKMAEYAHAFGQEEAVPYWKIVLSRGFHDVESHIRWAEESLDYLKKSAEEKSQLKEE